MAGKQNREQQEEGIAEGTNETFDNYNETFDNYNETFDKYIVRSDAQLRLKALIRERERES